MPERNNTAVAKRRVFDQRNAAAALVPRHLVAQIQRVIADRDRDLTDATGIEDCEMSRQQAVAAKAQEGFRHLDTHAPAAAGREDQSGAEGIAGRSDCLRWAVHCWRGLHASRAGNRTSVHARVQASSIESSSPKCDMPGYRESARLPKAEPVASAENTTARAVGDASGCRSPARQLATK